MDPEPGPFAPVIGRKAQGCWLGYGSVLFLEFGEPQPPNGQKHPSGEWSLWCDQVLWRIEQGDRVLAGSEDERPILKSAIEEINGRILVSGEISTATGDSLLVFSDGLVLRTFINTTEEDARWHLLHRGNDFARPGPHLAPAESQDKPRPTSVADHPETFKRKDTDTLQELSKAIWGAEVRQVRVNIQHRFEQGYSPVDLDELCLDFRKPLPVPKRLGKSDKVPSLWISGSTSGLRLQRAGTTVVSGGDPVAKVLEHFSKMVGSRLLSVEVQPPGGDAAFVFEDDAVLTCFPATSRQGSSWVIVSEAGDEWQLGPGARVKHDSGLR